MYGKLFTQIYDGTLATKGPWQALVTFQQLIALADKHGDVDMTAEAIARRTTIPLDIIETGLRALVEDDPQSRSPAMEGRRITLLSAERNWGWHLVNYEHYRNIRSEDDRREYHRRYYHEKRKAQTVSTLSTDSTGSTKAVSSKHKQNQKVNPIGGADAPPVVGFELEGEKPKAPGSNAEYLAAAEDVIGFLNKSCGRNYPVRTPSGLITSNAKVVVQRLQEGYTRTQLREVVAMLARKWRGDVDMARYLRPETIFGPRKFAGYVGQITGGDGGQGS